MKSSWQKVSVIAGEPLLARLSLNSILNKAQIIKRFYKGEIDVNFNALLTVNSIRKFTIVLHDPTADILRECLNVIESGKLNAHALVIMISGDNIDGRISFYSKAKKNNRIINYPYIENIDRQKFLQFLSGWEVDNNIKISNESKKWLLDNAPTISVKIKSANKNIDTYNLDVLNSELNKLFSITDKEIQLIDIKEFCVFEQTSDLWAFISAIITCNYELAFYMFDSIVDENGFNSLLWLLNSQIAFLIQIKDLLNRGIADPTQIQSQLNYNRYLNKYTGNDWNKLDTKEEPTINPWRIRKGIETLKHPNCSLSRLVNQQTNISNIITDFRFGFSEDILHSYLVLSLCGVVNYPNFDYL